MESDDDPIGENIDTSFYGVTPAKPNTQLNSVKVMKEIYKPQQSFFDLNQLNSE